MSASARSRLLPDIRTVDAARPLVWLRKGWQDAVDIGPLSWFHGLVLAAGGVTLLLLTYQRFWLMAGLISGFMLIAPVLATSLYALSRARERGEALTLALLHNTWSSWQHSRFSDKLGYWCLVRFGLLLALATSGWVVCSASLIIVLSPVPITGPRDFVLHVMLAKQGSLFELWLALGALLIAPVFASSVMTMPFLLDRQVSVWQAVLTSWRAVLANPVAMGLWAGLIVMLTFLGMGFLMLGLVVVLPVLGHASWHAYRDLVDVSGFVPRASQQ